MLRFINKALAGAALSFLLFACGGGTSLGDPSVFLESHQPGANSDPLAAIAPPTIRMAAALHSLDATSFLNWAESAYPNLFEAPQSNQIINVWTYRYYPKTDIYLGTNTSGDVLGLMGKGGGQYESYPLGKLTDFGCSVYPSDCVINIAPVANADAAQNVVAGSTVTLDGSASSDANSDPLTYAWTLTSKPAGSTATLSSASLAKPTFTADVAGAYVASLTVNDGKVSSSAVTVSITAALVNIANAGFARHVTTRTTVMLNGSASSNANNNPLQYQWSLTNKPGGSAASLVGATTATPTFTADKAGIYIASLIVTDGYKSSTPSTVNIAATGGRIAITDQRAFAVKSDGTVSAWGSNLNGELGDGTRTERLYPVAVTGLSGVVEISAGTFHTVALKSDGTVMTWGTGRLGNGIETSSLVPQRVAGLTNVVAIAAGHNTTVALKADGTVAAWGSNYSGKLGDGTTTDRLIPVTVPGLAGVIAIAAGVTHTVALKSDGTVFAWGDNTYGQLGDGTTASRASPSLVPGMTNVVAISAYRQTAAVKADGTVWMWGSNTSGQLGDGTITNRSSPTLVAGLTGVVSIATRETNTLALKGNGTVMAWGHWLGLGDGKGQNQYSPVETLALNTVAAVASGNMCGMVLNSDGTVWVWGMNKGEYGDGTKMNYSTSPIRISLIL